MFRREKEGISGDDVDFGDEDMRRRGGPSRIGREREFVWEEGRDKWG